MRYRPYFSKIFDPVLGSPAGVKHHPDDLAELPKDAGDVYLSKRTRNVDQLHRFKRIRTIECSWWQPEWIAQFERLPNLQHLQLSLSKVERLPSFAGLKKLRILVCDGFRHLKNWSFLNGIENLHSLCIRLNKPVNLRPLSTLTELRELYICDNPEIKSLAPLKTLAELRYLHLFHRVRKNQPSLKPLANLKKLNDVQIVPGNRIEEFEYLLARLPEVDEIKLNARLIWPPKGVDPDDRPRKGRMKFKTVQEGNVIRIAHDL